MTTNLRLKRVQVSKACSRCRKLQKGCNDYRPCQRCINAGLDSTCTESDNSPTSPNLTSRPLGSQFEDLNYTSAALLDFPSPQSFSVTRQTFRKQITLLPPNVVDHCSERFFSILYPTIPILSRDYLTQVRRDSEISIEGYCLIVALCAMVLLQVEQPDASIFETSDTNIQYGRMLLEEALSARDDIHRRSNSSLEHVLSTFFIYACHSALSYHSQAFFFLREAATLFLLLGSKTEKYLENRLFWVILISERSHAIRYHRPITLQLTNSSPPLEKDPSLAGFWSLAALFQPLDTTFIALINQERISASTTFESLRHIEASISGALEPSQQLLDTQKANLRVTQLWLRCVLWQVRLRLGQLSENTHPINLSYLYPIEIAKDLTLSTRDLPIESLKVHGVGLTEKLFDITCAKIDVMARIPLESQNLYGFSIDLEDNLTYLRLLINELPGGKSIYQRLLDKNIEQALPNFIN